MAVISIMVTESPVQKMYGIPISVTLSTNIPSTIFYTLDGSEPTPMSNIVVGPIVMPTNQTSVILRYYATNGIDESPSFSNVYSPNLTDDNLRRPRSQVQNLDHTCMNKSPLLGGGSTNGRPIYYGVGGDIVNNALVPGIYNGYDADGYQTGKTDKPWDLENYEIVFSQTNSIGETGKGLGTMPVEITIKSDEVPVPDESDANSPFFNPRAMVIIQDGTKEPFDPDHPIMMRPNFSMNAPDPTGIKHYTTANEGGSLTGSVCVPRYNYRNNTITFYYRDRNTGQWIISTEPYKPNPNTMNLSSMLFGRGSGVGRVFKWMPNAYRKLW